MTPILIYITAYLAVVILLLLFIQPRHRCVHYEAVKRYDYNRDCYIFYLRCQCGSYVLLEDDDPVIAHIGVQNFKNIS